MMVVNGLETADVEDTNVKGMGTKIVALENKKEKGLDDIDKPSVGSDITKAQESREEELIWKPKLIVGICW